ncbi:MAG: metal ABC transporter permease [Sphaerochaetaceae bacterium]|nr:metal ABC transporter permease [Sphaerochaetaceae bacterium]
MLELLLLPPILKGFVALLFAGVSFPLAGVMVTRLDMLPLRYMLMHSLLLGGAIALAFNFPPLVCYILLSLVTVLVMVYLSGGRNMHLGLSSAVLMVLSMAIASVIVQVFDVPAKDTLELIWGSPYTITVSELTIFILLSLVVVFYVLCFSREISILFFDRDVASTILKDAEKHRYVMVILVALVVALSMRFVGALLIDALLILPVITAGRFAKSLRGLFIYSSIIGFLVAVFGYLVSLALDFPPGATVAIVSSLIYLLSLGVGRKK